MTVLESILADLRSLPTTKLVDVARYVHSISATSQKEQAEVLEQTYGVLDEKDGQAFEEAIQRRVES